MCFSGIWNNFLTFPSSFRIWISFPFPTKITHSAICHLVSVGENIYCRIDPLILTSIIVISFFNTITIVDIFIIQNFIITIIKMTRVLPPCMSRGGCSLQSWSWGEDGWSWLAASPTRDGPDPRSSPSWGKQNLKYGPYSTTEVTKFQKDVWQGDSITHSGWTTSSFLTILGTIMDKNNTQAIIIILPTSFGKQLGITTIKLLWNFPGERQDPN